jgi:hypothetical protein
MKKRALEVQIKQLEDQRWTQKSLYRGLVREYETVQILSGTNYERQWDIIAGRMHDQNL